MISLYYIHIGLAVDGTSSEEIVICREVGKVVALRKLVNSQSFDFNQTLVSHAGIAHTRWATHGQPTPYNAHPHRSSDKNEFTVVHNGIITNYKEIKTVLINKGYKFESDTDTEIVAKLAHYVYESHKSNNKTNVTFSDLVKNVVKELVSNVTY
jgi:glucosamine--fructose-6-phosphate aminotransferase (isomerizing)